MGSHKEEKFISGIIKSFPKKYGRPRDFTFVIGENKRSYFFHISALKFGKWNDLVRAVEDKGYALIEFTHANTPRGRIVTLARMVK